MNLKVLHTRLKNMRSWKCGKSGKIEGIREFRLGLFYLSDRVEIKYLLCFKNLDLTLDFTKSKLLHHMEVGSYFNKNHKGLKEARNGTKPKIYFSGKIHRLKIELRL
ncbi:CLUMA_CG007831, isoform A [Clunio marinus]|uniref:CLUMA_CG007831, isoform A n=1 Tax=Clunio marinus TaxID=568069 RepID=A0A1J1I3Z2_9DIPT|nr:CLUMA_CG007831, isoform A [Clunio marinus]